MTRYEKDVKAIQNGEDGIIILMERKEELDNLFRKGKAEKNAFRRDTIAHEYVQRLHEYERLSEMV